MPAAPAPKLWWPCCAGESSCLQLTIAGFPLGGDLCPCNCENGTRLLKSGAVVTALPSPHEITIAERWGAGNWIAILGKDEEDDHWYLQVVYGRRTGATLTDFTWWEYDFGTDRPDLSEISAIEMVLLEAADAPPCPIDEVTITVEIIEDAECADEPATCEAGCMEVTLAGIEVNCASTAPRFRCPERDGAYLMAPTGSCSWTGASFFKGGDNHWYLRVTKYGAVWQKDFGLTSPTDWSELEGEVPFYSQPTNSGCDYSAAVCTVAFVEDDPCATTDPDLPEPLCYFPGGIPANVSVELSGFGLGNCNTSSPPYDYFDDYSDLNGVYYPENILNCVYEYWGEAVALTACPFVSWLVGVATAIYVRIRSVDHCRYQIHLDIFFDLLEEDEEPFSNIPEVVFRKDWTVDFNDGVIAVEEEIQWGSQTFTVQVAAS